MHLHALGRGPSQRGRVTGEAKACLCVRAGAIEVLCQLLLYGRARVFFDGCVRRVPEYLGMAPVYITTDVGRLAAKTASRAHRHTCMHAWLLACLRGYMDR